MLELLRRGEAVVVMLLLLLLLLRVSDTELLVVNVLAYAVESGVND